MRLITRIGSTNSTQMHILLVLVLGHGKTHCTTCAVLGSKNNIQCTYINNVEKDVINKSFLLLLALVVSIKHATLLASVS